MRHKLASLLFVLLLLCAWIPIQQATGFTIVTDALGPTEQQTHIQTYSSLISPLPHEPYHTPINSFDVNEDAILLCCSGSSNKGNELLVYDHSGTFLYGFTFDPSSAFCITLNGTDTILYLYRTYLAITVDETATITDVRSISDSHENTQKMNAMHNIKSIPLQEAVYEVRKDEGGRLMSGYSYNKLMRIDVDGNERVLYDATGDAARRGIFFIITISLFLGCILFFVIRSMVEKVNAHTNSTAQANTSIDKTEAHP